jgi:phosphinothricin acetyltransferase
VELSVYVAPDATGVGVGGALYTALLERLARDDRFHRAYAIVALPNPSSSPSTNGTGSACVAP